MFSLLGIVQYFGKLKVMLLKPNIEVPLLIFFIALACGWVRVCPVGIHICSCVCILDIC